VDGSKSESIQKHRREIQKFEKKTGKKQCLGFFRIKWGVKVQSLKTQIEIALGQNNCNQKHRRE